MIERKEGPWGAGVKPGKADGPVLGATAAAAVERHVQGSCTVLTSGGVTGCQSGKDRAIVAQAVAS